MKIGFYKTYYWVTLDSFKVEESLLTSMLELERDYEISLTYCLYLSPEEILDISI